MNYKIRYTLPYADHSCTMGAKDEKQLATFVKMLADEQACGIEVIPKHI